LSLLPSKADPSVKAADSNERVVPICHRRPDERVDPANPVAARRANGDAKTCEEVRINQVCFYRTVRVSRVKKASV
jgi:hypothetical protein